MVLDDVTAWEWIKLRRKRPNAQANKTNHDYIYVSNLGEMKKTLREVRESLAANPTKVAISAVDSTPTKVLKMEEWIASCSQPAGLCCSPESAAMLLQALHEIAETHVLPSQRQSDDEVGTQLMECVANMLINMWRALCSYRRSL